MIDAAVTLFTAGLMSRFDDLPPDPDLRIAVETVVRVVLSHVMQPSGRPEQTADDIAFFAARALA